MLWSFKSVLWLMLLWACSAETEDWVSSGKETYRITIEVDSPDCQQSSRSSLASSEVDKITDMNIFVYHDGILLKDCCRYCTDPSSVLLAFPQGLDGFNIYMLGNVGYVEAPAEESQMEMLSYVVDSYESFRTRGFPVAEKFCGYRKGSLAHFKVRRLVGQYDIRMKNSTENARYAVKDVRFLNCAMDMYPFGEGTKATVFSDKMRSGGNLAGDRLTESDIEALNAGETVSLYFVENLQGVLLPDNKDRKKKIPSILNEIEDGLAECCTYMEVTADITTQSAKYTDGKYRFYLGGDETSDFSIKRNTRYCVVLDFTQNMVNEEEWRIDVGEPEVNDVFVSKDVAKVIMGVEDRLYVQAYGTDGALMDFDVLRCGSHSSGFVVDKSVSTYDGRPAVAVSITSNQQLSGCYGYGAVPDYHSSCLKLRSKETYNGKPLWEKDVEVRIYYKLFPLLIKLERNDYGSLSVVLRGHNPMGLSVYMSADYRCTDGFTGTVSNRGKYADISVSGMEVSEFGRLDPRVTPSTLERVDFVVKCDRGDSGYPRLIREDMVYVGDAPMIYGPGTDMYPAKWPVFPDDSKIYLEKEGSGMGVWGTGNWIEGYDGKFETEDLVYYTIYQYYGVELYSIKDLGSCSWNGNCPDYCKHTPFYFINGCMEYADIQWTSFKAAVKWPDKTWCGGDIRLVAPGRDLFFDYKDDEVVRTHKIEWRFTYWKNLLGKYKTHHETKKYQGRPYMTINNSVRWIGGDRSADGFFTDTY